MVLSLRVQLVKVLTSFKEDVVEVFGGLKVHPFMLVVYYGKCD
jgi:hypothetical protein